MKNINEVMAWLDSQVGKSVGKPNGDYKGQCVSLVQLFLAWLVPGYDGNKARGDAKDYNASPIPSGNGKFTVNINRSMGGGYGHIWLDYNGTTWEQNHKPLTVTKNTAGTFKIDKCFNLDQYINFATQTPGSGWNPINQLKEVTVDKLNVRSAPSTNAPIVATYEKGGRVRVNGWKDENGYRWNIYVSNSGATRYIAEGTAGQSNGYMKVVG